MTDLLVGTSKTLSKFVRRFGSLFVLFALASILFFPNHAAAQSRGVIVDDTDAVFGGAGDGDQPDYLDVISSGYGGGAHFTGNSIDSTARNWATWSADGLSGELEVSVTIPTGPYIYSIPDPYYGTVLPLTQSATYVVTHAGGTTEVVVDQRANEGGAVSLGTFTFEGTGSVYLTDVVGENGQVLLSSIAMDAVSFGGDLGDLDITPPKIEDVKAQTHMGNFYIQAKITDEGSGVALAQVFFNGEFYDMNVSGDIYSAKLPHAANIQLNYYILAKDGAGNSSIWQPGRGYISIGTFARQTGVAPWAFYSGKLSCVAGNPCDNQYVGDPINTLNGNLVDENHLITVGGRPEIDLGITYNSQGGLLSIFGQNWTHTYNYQVLDMNNADFVGALVRYPDGRVVMFEGKDYTPESGIFERLIATGDGYELILQDLRKVKFDADGDIVRYEDPNGNGLNFKYGEKIKFTLLSEIAAIQADGGREILFEYENNLVTAINAPEGKTLRFEYDENDDLLEIEDANGGKTQFEYEKHKMTRKVSPEGHDYFSNQYDDEGRVIKQHAGEGFDHEFEYQGSQTVVTDGNGNQMTYVYNSDELLTEVKNSLGDSVKYEYNSDKKVSKITNREGHERYMEYDPNGNMVWEKDEAGNVTEIAYDTNLNKPITIKYKQADHITTFEYDSRGNLTKMTNAKGDSSSYEYNEFGQLSKSIDFNSNVTEYAYNDYGDRSEVKDALGYVNSLEYDGLGRLVRTTNPRGFSYDLAYDPNDNLKKFAGPLGYKLKFEYNANNKLTSSTDANGGIVRYEYDDADNMIKTTNQLGFETKFEFGAMNEMLAQVDPENRIARYQYDPAYNITKMTNASGTADEVFNTIGYFGDRQISEVVDAEGRILRLNLDPLDRVLEQVANATGANPDSENNVKMAMEYSATGKVLKTTDPNGNITVFEYDVLDQLVKKQDAENQIDLYEYDKQGNLIKHTNPRGFETNYQYDPLNRVQKVTDAKGGNTHFGYDPNGNMVMVTDANGIKTKSVFDELDRQSQKIENFVDGGAQNEFTNVVSKYNYDLHGNLIKFTNPRGYATHFVYDAAHRRKEIIDATNHKTVIEYDKVNNILRVTDRNGNQENFKYDNLNRLVEYKNAEGHFETYTYDKVGNITSFRNMRGKIFNSSYDPLNRLKVATDVYSKTKTFVYDPVGNVLSMTDENGHTDKYQYDKIYRTLKQIDAEDIPTQFVYDPNSNIVEVIDGEQNSTDFEYDELDRMVSKINAESEEEQYVYDALKNVTRYIEADGTVRKYNYDGMYRLREVVDNWIENQPSTNDQNVLTKYDYDHNGNLTNTINPLSASTQFGFDSLDRLIEEKNPLGSIWNYKYDAEANVIARIDANGATTNYSYYPDYELKEIVYPDYSVHYNYSETNYPVNMADNLGITTWNYDDLDRLVFQNDPYNRKLEYQYDFVGNTTLTKYPDGRSVSSEYLKNDWLKKSKSSDNDEIKYIRNRVGLPTRVDKSNSSYSETTYDKVYRTLEIHDRQIGSGNHLISKFEYEYNDVGHIVEEVAEYGWRQPSRVVSENGYDGLHRLVSVESDNDQETTYTYDAAGNRTHMTDMIQQGLEQTAYVYNSANQLLEVDVDSPLPPNNLVHKFVYDLNGNRIDKLTIDQTGIDRGVEYTYDTENRLIKAQDYQMQLPRVETPKPGSTKGKNAEPTPAPVAPTAKVRNDLAHTELEYDGNSRRLAQTYYPGASQGGKRTEYTFDRLDPVAEYDIWNGQYKNMYRDSEQNLMFFQTFRSQQDPNGTLYWYHFDGEGNIAATTKHRAQSDHTYRYDEYGNILPEHGNVASNKKEGAASGWAYPHNEYTLSQKQYDDNTDLYYFGSRHYDPTMGVWLTQDRYRGETRNPMSQHRYMYNYSSPVNYIDWYGFEPRWGQLGSLMDIRIETGYGTAKSATADVSSKLEALSTHFEANRYYVLDEKTGRYTDTKESKNVKRYIYTTKAGWIDMHHFFRVGSVYWKTGLVAAVLYCDASELGQAIINGTTVSTYSYEDYTSNRAGIAFVDKYGQRINSGQISMENAVTEFLQELGAVDPNQAPNYEYIPHYAKEGGAVLTSRYPLVGETLREAHKEHFDNLPVEEQNKIRKAHEQIDNSSTQYAK